MKIPSSVQKLINAFEKLPGIGPKTSQRLVFYLLHTPQKFLTEFSQALLDLKKKIKICSLCFNIDEIDPCQICSNPERNITQICVVEQPLDVLAIEKTGFYHGLYHVLHGVINPLENIGPDDLHLKDLLPRLENDKIKELIIATNPTMEGEATAIYLVRLLKEKMKNKIKNLRITRLGRGLPTGADIEYADEITLSKAFEGRREY